MIQRIDHNNNFNALRLCAALLVMLDHALDAFSINIELFTHNSVFGIGIGTFGVTIFFVISGFLVTQSWLNTQRVDLFLLNRAIRIYPALLVNVAITLLLIFISSSFLSSIQTSVELNALIASPFKAFQAISQEIPAILQRVTFILIPDAISKLHNISLWTLPYEVLCYSILCILCFFINPKKSIPIFTILY
ncbi:MAG: acyltransferase family protein, partial [Rickettsiales bacterium]